MRRDGTVSPELERRGTVTTVRSTLPRSAPEPQGVDPRAVLATVDALVANPDLHSVMVVRHGQVVAEGWAHPYRADLRHQLFSLTKSFTSTAVGLAVGEGLLGLDDLVVGLLPDKAPARPDERLSRLSVRHLLTMTSGHDTDPSSRVFDVPGDWVEHFLAIPLEHEPGTHFVYNTAATHVLSAIVQRVTGQRVLDYLTPRVLEPLGIEDAVTERSPQGVDTGGFGMYLRTEDIAKFGLLYLHDGVWEGRRLLPQGWVAQATAHQVPNGDPAEPSDWAQGYGFQFWRCRGGFYRGDGAFGQFCVVVPQADLVVAITSGTEDLGASLDAIRAHLLPGLSDEPLPADPAGSEALAARLAGLRVEPPAGEAVTATARRVSGRTVAFDPNPAGLRHATLVVGDEEDRLTVHLAGGPVTVRVGHGDGVEQHFPLPGHRDPTCRPTVVHVAGAWTGPDRYTVAARYLETPFAWRVTVDVDGDAVTVTAAVNVSFEPTRLPPVTGRILT